MNTTSHSPLGNFEERLLLQLKAEVASRASAIDVARTPQRVRRFRTIAVCSRIAVPVGGAIAALVVAALSILPAAQPALARAFPILTHQSVTLPDRYRQALQAQRLAASNGPLIHDRAYSFETPIGTGYVVVDPRDRWLCILVPRIGSNNTGIRCETAHQLLQGTAGGIRVVTHQDNRSEIVELLRQNVTASVITNGTRTTTDDNGILAITTTSTATITTTIAGKRSTITYRP
jgi:hypothetical protein